MCHHPKTSIRGVSSRLVEARARGDAKLSALSEKVAQQEKEASNRSWTAEEFISHSRRKAHNKPTRKETLIKHTRKALKKQRKSSRKTHTRTAHRI